MNLARFLELHTKGKEMFKKIRENTEYAILSSKQHEFLNDLEDSEYRKVFAEELIGTSLAFQIRRLREARGLTQQELAQAAGKKQETISQWENPDYGRYTLSTLKTLAGAFDTGLLVRFVSFSELADWTIDVSPNRLTPPSYAEESQLSFATHDSSFVWPSIDYEPVGQAPNFGYEEDTPACATADRPINEKPYFTANAGEEAYANAAD